MEKDNKKITSFEITDDMLSDPELDLLLKEDLIREADEIEKKMEQDEDLRGVGASDDLFQSIVDKLKEQNVWEGNAPASDDSRTVYDMLSEEDRLNIEAGKVYRKQEEVRKKKRRKRAKILKRGGMVAAVFAIVFGLGMTSEANRRLVLKAWDGLKYNLNFRLSTNYAGHASVRSKTREEIEAMEEIKKKIGAPAIDFQYLPEGMRYERYDVVENNKEAYIFYSWNDKIINVSLTYMPNTNYDGSVYVMFNQGAEIIDVVKNDQELEIYLLATDQNLEKPIYVLEIQYNDFRYVMNGLDSLDEIKKIAKYSMIL